MGPGLGTENPQQPSPNLHVHRKPQALNSSGSCPRVLKPTLQERRSNAGLDIIILLILILILLLIIIIIIIILRLSTTGMV